MTTTCDSARTALFLYDCCTSRHEPRAVITRGGIRGRTDVEVVGDGADGCVIRHNEDVGEAVGAIAAASISRSDLQRVGRTRTHHPRDEHVVPLSRDG